MCRIPDMNSGYYNFAYIPSDSIITGDTNGRKSISFSVYLKYHEPNENDIIKSGKYKLEYSKHTGYYVKKLGIKKINIIHYSRRGWYGCHYGKVLKVHFQGKDKKDKKDKKERRVENN